MRYGIVDPTGLVVNVIEYDDAPSTPPAGFPEGFIAVQADLVGTGWKFEDGALVAPPQEVIPLPPITSVTPRQARLALLVAGLLDQVDAAVTTAGGATKITWDYATEINRNDPLITSIGAALGLTSAQIDALFAHAATL